MTRPNVQFRHSFRWIHAGAASAVHAFTYVTPQSLSKAVSMVTSNPIGVTATYYGLFNAVRIRRIQMWFSPPDVALGTIPPSQGWTISVNWTRAVNTASFVAGQEVADTALNTNHTAYVSAVPPSTMLASQWVAYTDASSFFALRTYPGTIIQIDADCIVQDTVSASLASGSATTSTGVGVVVAACLDDNAASGSRIFAPCGLEPVLL